MSNNLDQRRTAISAVGDELRALVDAVVRTDADPQTVHGVAESDAHGGMSAMILDELMGRACAEKGPPAMTVSLTVAYHRPVWLQRALVARAHVARVQDRTIHVTGSIAGQAAPDIALVTADGVFAAPDPARVRVLFPQLIGVSDA
jgi:uncharacterized protein (TIGR00369 family)